MNQVRVNRKAAGRVASGHPWIFQSDIVDHDGAQPGQPVQVADPRGRPLGTAHYSSASQISLRMLSGQVEEIGRDFFLRASAAEQHRHRGLSASDAYRVVHGEADLLPRWWSIATALTTRVMQTLTRAWTRRNPKSPPASEEIFHPKGIVARNDVAVRAKEELPLETTVVSGEVPDSVAVRMNGLTLRADLLHGQKTGIFLDQRENYRAAALYARGGKALDCFTSTGGFALHLAPKCESVEAVDSSGPALATARANAQANGIANTNSTSPHFRPPAYYSSARRQFSLVVLDPLAFAKRNLNPRHIKRLTRALRLLAPGGT
jgi:23S rRNA (cytosine1962-C5)-methyltransferase